MKTIKFLAQAVIMVLAIYGITHICMEFGGVTTVDKPTASELASREPVVDGDAVGPSSKSAIMARDMIADFEGFSPDVYTCPAGKRTTGYGFTDKKSLLLAVDGKMTKEYAKEILLAKVVAIQMQIVKDFEDRGADQPNDNELAAMSSLVYNIGWTNWSASTLRNKWLTKKPKTEIAAEFGRWVYANKRVLRGLVNRRNAEKDLFLKK
jgi:lysozyme